MISSGIYQPKFWGISHSIAVKGTTGGFWTLPIWDGYKHANHFAKITTMQSYNMDVIYNR